jgi:prepilin-type processing-associated H-X9-DG protein
MSYKEIHISPDRRKRMLHSLGEEAFSRIELCAVLGALVLAGSVALPAVATRARSEQAACVSNLRQIGRAHQVWMNDREGVLPSFVPVSQGGARNFPNPSTAAWVQFSILTNELSTPKVLACPSDTKRPASEFSTNPERGLFHANFRNSAISYFLGHPVPQTPRGILAGDRNIRVTEAIINCSVFGSSPSSIWVKPTVDTSVRWTNGLHMNAGNFLYLDGQVEQLSNIGLQKVLTQPVDDNGALHLLMP